MGLGTKDGGVGAAIFAHDHGARVTVTDLLNESDLKDSLAELEGMDIRFALGGHNMKDFIEADMVIRNPGIKRSSGFLTAAADAGTAVESPIGLFCEIVSVPWVGITGTKGKSFTTHLVSHILRSAGVKTVAAGNNCVSPLRIVDDVSICPVLELSSWQLSEMNLHRKSPHTGCWLNFFPDHMNWYSSTEEYRFDKETIVRHQSENDIIILPYDDPVLSGVSGSSERYYFSSAYASPREIKGSFIEDGWLVWRDPAAIRLIRVDTLPDHMKLPVHLDLIAPAVCCAVAAGADPMSIAEGIASFPGIPHRFQFAGRYGRIRLINDSAATTPDSVMKAIENLDGSKLVLIAGGGGHKNLDYDPLASLIVAEVHLVILFSDDPASIRLRTALSRMNQDRIRTAGDMHEAVNIGISCLDPGEDGILLLSPGCSGAPLFTDLFQRGDQFISAARAFTGSGEL